jgi:hypothetical protein
MSTTGAEGFSPTGGAGMLGAGMAETQRVLEGLVGPLRITSSARRARLAFKCCVNGISVRTLIHDIRGGAGGIKRLRHPKKGMLRFAHASFQANDDPDLKLIIYTPA